jgi:hypothetical protein
MLDVQDKSWTPSQSKSCAAGFLTQRGCQNSAVLNNIAPVQEKNRFIVLRELRLNKIPTQNYHTHVF